MDAKVRLAHSHAEAAEGQVISIPNQAPEIADLLVTYLEQIGIEYVFGVPGGAIEPLYNALTRSEGTLYPLPCNGIRYGGQISTDLARNKSQTRI